MPRRMVALLALVMVPAGLGAQAPLTGVWTVVVTGPAGATSMRARLVEEEGVVSGTLSTGQGDVPLRGTRTGATVTLRWSFPLGDERLEVTLDGTIERDPSTGADNALAGTVKFADAEPATWSATRAPDAGPAAAPAGVPADVAGNWTLTLETPQGATPLSVTLRQRGAEVDGSARTPIGSFVSVIGTIRGRSLTFSLEVEPSPLTVTAEVEGETLAGTFRLGVEVEGNVVGRKTGP